MKLCVLNGWVFHRCLVTRPIPRYSLYSMVNGHQHLTLVAHFGPSQKGVQSKASPVAGLACRGKQEECKQSLPYYIPAYRVPRAYACRRLIIPSRTTRPARASPVFAYSFCIFICSCELFLTCTTMHNRPHVILFVHARNALFIMHPRATWVQPRKPPRRRLAVGGFTVSRDIALS